MWNVRVRLQCSSHLAIWRRSRTPALLAKDVRVQNTRLSYQARAVTSFRPSSDELDEIDKILNDTTGTSIEQESNEKLEGAKNSVGDGGRYSNDISSKKQGVSPGLRGKYRLHILGSKHSYGPREYLLLPLNVGIRNNNLGLDQLSQKARDLINQNKIASLFSNQGTLLGANCSTQYPLDKCCGPLVKKALKEIELDGRFEGEQIQALAALDGLCDWAAGCIAEHGKGSQVLEDLFEQSNNYHNDESRIESDRFRLQLEAVEAIATGTPRPGHSVVGEGTYRDGEETWRALAKEFGRLGLAPEVELYRRQGASIAEAVHLADRSPSYLRKAGGAMLRMFFLT